MREIIIMILFSAGILFCIFAGISILPALLLGYCLFFGYGIYKKWTFKDMLGFSFQGIFAVKSVLVSFVLIGVITAVWRASGTIAFIVYQVTRFCSPAYVVLIAFFMCAVLSVLTGSALASSATVGVIAMTVAESMHAPIWLVGGAVLAGAYFGDRCSPMSTSALLVCEVTKTNIFDNIKNMIRTSWIPFMLTCVIYLVMGRVGHTGAGGGGNAVNEILAGAYYLSWVTVLPAVVVIVFSLLKIDVKYTLIVSAAIGMIIAALCQKMQIAELFIACIVGYSPENVEVRNLMQGGGLCSMINVFLIVCVSSSYAGMFEATHFLDGVQKKLEYIRYQTTDFMMVMMTAVVAGVISCGQALTIMLTNQLCEKSIADKEKRAIYLENTAVVLSPLIPWSVAATTPLAAAGAPLLSIAAAVYLYILPLWQLMVSVIEKRHERAE